MEFELLTEEHGFWNVGQREPYQVTGWGGDGVIGLWLARSTAGLRAQHLGGEKQENAIMK